MSVSRLTVVQLVVSVCSNTPVLLFDNPGSPSVSTRCFCLCFIIDFISDLFVAHNDLWMS